MAAKLWYIRNEDGPVAVFEDKRAAKDELENYQIENEDDDYRLYAIMIDDLEDYEDELSLAEAEGLV
ncbi:MAG: hypothetical protein JXB03_07895 [Spirochaetales bacterium]|nr:hypothetical protein [Spirochaetales bacterium]